jgi:uncharacterized protein YprB with RNaseH-like and TPR domain
MSNCVEAYLDIETTGLSTSGCDVTVIGIHICDGDDTRFIQLIGKEITVSSILEALEGVHTLYTYNGSRFDLPFIHGILGLDLSRKFAHHDLMYDCWQKNLYGGLKGVERQLGIPRILKDMDGYEAVKLWWKYVENFDTDALKKLCDYNKEDVVNLRTLKAKLLEYNRR